MAKPAAEITRVLKAKDKGLVKGAQSMLSILKSLHKEVMAELGQAALGSWDAYHLKKTLDAIEFQIANYSAKSQAELSGLLDESWGMGKNLVDAPLLTAGAGGIWSGTWLSTSALDTLKDYSSDYLKSLFSDAWYKVKGEITLGIAGNKTPQEVTKAIGRTLQSGRFKNIANRAETITKVEMGTVFSKAAQLRMEQAAKAVPALEKMWRHAGHPRKARPSHVSASGQHVPVDRPFMVGGVAMMFPRDPGAPVSEIVHCGCDHVPYMAQWQ